MGLMKLSFLLLLIYTFDVYLAKICMSSGKGCPEGYHCEESNGMICRNESNANDTKESSWDHASPNCTNGFICPKNQFCYRGGCIFKVILIIA